MDYFAVGGRPFLSRFPPHIPGIFNPSRFEQEASGAVYFGADDGQEASGAGILGAHDLGASSAYSTAGAVASGAAPGYPPFAAMLPGAADQSAASLQLPVVEPLAPGSFKAPAALHTGFDPCKVGVWDPCRFAMVRKLQDATRNRGQVHLMRDTLHGVSVAVKQMPNRWFRLSHKEFVIEHPSETEMPWQDVGCVSFLNSTGFLYACDLLGVFRDDEHTYVVTSFASEGDLFSWCEGGVPPGRQREHVVHPLARQILKGVQQLHDMGILHRDLSLENILMSKTENCELLIRIIDFGMASTTRHLQNCVRGKASYQAPELHAEEEYDAFLSDAFSIGVTLYAALVKDYPWLSTRPGGCKCFEYVRKHGFRSYLDKRKLRNSQARVGQVMSEPLKQLLEGLLALDPSERLTLGEASWASDGNERDSVWDEPWLRDGP